MSAMLSRLMSPMSLLLHYPESNISSFTPNAQKNDRFAKKSTKQSSNAVPEILGLSQAGTRRGKQHESALPEAHQRVLRSTRLCRSQLLFLRDQ